MMITDTLSIHFAHLQSSKLSLKCASEVVLALRFTRSVSSQLERNRVCILNSFSEVSQMECGHPGSFFYRRGLKSFSEVFEVARQLGNTAQPVFG